MAEKPKLPDELRPLTREEIDAFVASCESWACTRMGSTQRRADGSWDKGRCVGYHCPYCGESCSMMGHDCVRGERVRASLADERSTDA